MRLKLILFMVVMIPCYQVIAQESQAVIDIYDQETTYIHYSILGDGFVKNGQIMDIGPFGSRLAKEIAGSEYALAEMQKARRHKILSTVTNLAATAFEITGLVLTFRDKDDDNGLAIELGSILIGGTLGILADGFNRSAMAEMNRAVWLYNRDVVSGRIRK